MSDQETAMSSDLIDLDECVLTDIEELDNSVLAHALRRVLAADADGSEDPIASFGAFI